MGRAPCCDKNGLKKGPWTPEEDLMLINYIQKNGPGNWRNLPKNAGLQRCGKSCRLRWTNYLRPDIKRGRFSFEEEESIIQLHSVLGNKWSAIAARLPGRTDNEIKNYWNTHIRKRLLRMGIDPVTHAPRLDFLDLSSILASSSLCNPSLLNLSSLLGTQALFNPELLRLASTILSLNNKQHQNTSPELFNSQNLQESQLCSNQLQNQIPPLVQPNLNHDQFQTQIPEGFSMQAPNVDHQSNMANPVSSCPISTQENITTSSTIPSSTTLNENVVASQPSHVNCSFNNSNTPSLIDDLPESSYFQNLMDGYSDKGFSFDSVISTPSSSSPTPLNSSSTYNINSTSSTEDEKEISYCGNLLKFEIPQSLDINDFL